MRIKITIEYQINLHFQHVHVHVIGYFAAYIIVQIVIHYNTFVYQFGIF